MSGRVYLDNWGEIVIDFPKNDALKSTVRCIPTAHYDFYERHGWRVWPSKDVIRTVLSLARQYDMAIHPAFSLTADELVQCFENKRYESSHALEPDLHFKPPLSGLTPLQVAGVQYAIKAMCCWIADESERDRIAIALVTLQAANAFPAFIVCPASRIDAWRQALAHYLPAKKWLPYEAARTDSSVDLVLIHYETLDTADVMLQMLNRRPYGLILDEAHYLKNLAARRTRRSLALARGVHYRLLLTATPIINGPFELIGQLKVMGRLDEFGGYDHFFQHYCRGQENGAVHLDELGRLLRTHCLLRRQTRSRAILTRHYHNVPINNRDRYNAKEIAASKADNWPGWHTALRLELAWGKLGAAVAWIRNFLEKTDEKLVVFAYHREIVDAIASTFQAPSITSETSEPKRAMSIEQFVGDKGHRLIVIGIRADSRGWSLKPACQALFVESGFTPTDQERAERLLAQPAKAHYLIAVNTIEESFYGRIEDKQGVIRRVLDTL